MVDQRRDAAGFLRKCEPIASGVLRLLCKCPLEKRFAILTSKAFFPHAIILCTQDTQVFCIISTWMSLLHYTLLLSPLILYFTVMYFLLCVKRKKKGALDQKYSNLCACTQEGNGLLPMEAGARAS